MGSVNCKEYITSTKNNDPCSNQPDNGLTGSYHSTSEETPTKTAADTSTEEETVLKMSDDEYTEPVEICNVADIAESGMKQFSFNEDVKLLLIKQNGQLKAIGNKCTHYGAPLHTGVLGEGRVRCPWHGACFSIETGDIEDFPGLDSIPCYKVEVNDDGKVHVRAKRKDLENHKRLKDMVKRDMADERCFVVVGGGPAGAVCVETLRQEGFTGRIVMICRENALPYDRVKVSKAMDMNLESIQFRDADFYKEHAIETWLGVEATKLNVEKKTVLCSNEEEIKYDKIFIATGCCAAKAPIPGAHLQNVVTVRDIAEANGIAASLTPEMNVVCLGASFIALETASYLVSKVNSVTLIGRDSVPLLPSFGEKIGERVLRLFQENNVNMLMNSGISEISGKDAVSAVRLVDGTELPCDLLIMGTGSRFYTDFLRDSDVPLNPNGSIDTDKCLMTSVPDVFAGGDIANAPVYAIGNEKVSIGHFQLAEYHGRIAAKNMAGNLEELHAVPFFFTMLFGKGFRYAGYGKFTDVHIEGDLENLKFVAYFLNPMNLVIAVASCQRDPIVASYAELRTQGRQLKLSDVKDHAPCTWAKMLNRRDSASGKCK